jgi:hypothetical protein
LITLCDLVEPGPQRLANSEAVRHELLVFVVLVSIVEYKVCFHAAKL